MQGINRIELLGQVISDPRIITAQNGNKFASFRLATTEEWKDKTTGQSKTISEYHNIAVYSPNTVEVVENLIQKDTVLFVVGKVKSRKYEQNGVEKYITEVVVDFSGSITCLAKTKSIAAPQPQQPQPAPQAFVNNDIFDKAESFMANTVVGDDIPF